jgi:hypothetical protein
MSMPELSIAAVAKASSVAWGNLYLSRPNILATRGHAIGTGVGASDAIAHEKKANEG